jgi:hypothetical protein
LETGNNNKLSKFENDGNEIDIHKEEQEEDGFWRFI